MREVILLPLPVKINKCIRKGWNAKEGDNHLDSVRSGSKTSKSLAHLTLSHQLGNMQHHFILLIQNMCMNEALKRSAKYRLSTPNHIQWARKLLQCLAIFDWVRCSA